MAPGRHPHDGSRKGSKAKAAMISATATFRPRNDAGRFVQARISPAVTASVQAACELIQDTAKNYAPVDTGALRESIVVDVKETGSTVKGTVSVGVPYAAYVEFGTGRRGESSPGAGEGPYDPNWAGMPAQPYMRPAVDESREPIKDLFKSNLSVAVEG